MATNFFLNAGDAIGLIISNLVVLCGAAAAVLVKPTSDILRRQRTLLTYPAALRIGVEAYLDFNMAIALQLRNLSENSIANITAVIFAFTTIFAYLGLLY